MKPLATILALIFCMGQIFSTSSCAVVVLDGTPQHKGWKKNPNNPHHPFSTNPGHKKGKHMK